MSRLSQRPFFLIAATIICMNVGTGRSFGFSRPALQEKQTKAKPAKPKAEELEEAVAQRRAVAISLVTTLAAEARSFHDQTRRARVQARAADVLWEADPERSRELFRRAWDAAETADSDTAKLQSEEMRKLRADGGPVAMSGRPDVRSEVLRLVAKRDRMLGEQFLQALDEANERETNDAAADLRRNAMAAGPGASKRLQLARRLLEDGDADRAMEFAGPVLDQVNRDAIFFLSALRAKKPQPADAAFSSLLARAARNPLSDANTVAGLSSYLFTPFLYVIFEPDGGSNVAQERGATTAPMVDPALRNNFLRVAFQILMAPSPAPDQDHTTSGRVGKYLVIKRLLPLFEQYASDLAAPLRTQMTALGSDVPDEFRRGDNRAVSRGIVPDETESDPYQRMQERLDHAAKSEERDAIYADYAVAFAGKGDPRAKDLVDKIENTELRKNVRAYTDFQRAELAIQNKDTAEAARIARSGELTSMQKVWTFTSAARLLGNSERSRAVELLEDALAESRRIGGSDPDRARALTAVAAAMVEVDPVRAWETLNEVVKAGNAAEGFTGEDTRISSRLQTQQMVVMTNAPAGEFDLLLAFRLLAREDLLRAIQLAKSFTGEAPRAVATLAIARSVLEKSKDTLVAGSN
jgi:hypothetical protein